jgi:CRISPR-associated protein Cas1
MLEPQQASLLQRDSQPGMSASDSSETQAELFATDALPAREPRPRRRGRMAATRPKLDEAIREVLDLELKTEARTPPPESQPCVGEDWLPARMINEFVYCPRLFFYEHVDGVFVHNADTEKGKDIHSRVDKGTGELAPAGNEPEVIHSRSVQLGSDRLRVSAKLDLVESDGTGGVSPVDYKAGKPREGDQQLEIWPADRVQLGLQMWILRENGYSCERGFIYYRTTRQRVALDWDSGLETWIEAQVIGARALLRGGMRPSPLVDSPKCPRCSLVGVCLPDETRALQAAGCEMPESTGHHATENHRSPPRRLIAARDDARALYLNTHGLRVGIRDRVLDVKEKDRSIEQIRLSDTHHVALFGNVQLSTQALQQLCEEEIPVTYFSMGGWFYGITRGHSLSNILLRRAQFRAADDPARCLALAARFVAGKIRNARKLLMRNSLTQPAPAIARLRRAAQDALEAPTLESLLGIEGAAAAVYFDAFAGMLKPEDDDLPGLEAPADRTMEFSFDFTARNRRPPRDPVNALLSLAYSLLAKDCTIALLATGFDPWLGLYHQPRPGRPALALDLMEEFRPLVAESAVLSAINNRMVTPADFVRAGDAVNLSKDGRRKFFHAYEQRMSHLIVHPVFAYKVSYRRALELQARLLARVIEGEIPHYIPMVTR